MRLPCSSSNIHRPMRWLLLLTLVTSTVAEPHGVRDRTRPDHAHDTAVSESQAVELTLTLVPTTEQTLQTWVRTSAKIDSSGKVLSASLCSSDADLAQVGQRVRAFPPDSKSSIYQAKITHVNRADPCSIVDATLSREPYNKSPRYVMEIIVQRGAFLSIPNEAIIEEGDTQVVYVEQEPGRYLPQEIHTGLKGELYTQVLHGLSKGDQVVTLGSFFIDAEFKLKVGVKDSGGDAHLHH